MDGHILVIPTSWLPSFQGFLPVNEGPKLFEQLTTPGTCWIKRALAEQDINFKQVVPVVMLVDHQDPTKVFCYRRASKEEVRLQGKRSILVGGHLEFLRDVRGSYHSHPIFNCLLRETKEETSLTLSEGNFQLLGYMSSTESEVSKVHLGLLFLARIDPQEIMGDPNEIAEWEMVPVSSILVKGPMDDWSKIAQQVLLDLAKARTS